MKSKAMLTLVLAGLLAVTLSSTALAGARGRYGGVKQSSPSLSGAQQRLRDGSCVTPGSPVRDRKQQNDRVGDTDRIQQRDRLQDGSCLK